jgi:hypothetical protein
MPDVFDLPALDEDAIDLAWHHFQTGHLSRFEAALTMALSGVTFVEAQSLLSCTSLPNPTLPHARRWVEAYDHHLAVLRPDEIIVSADRNLDQYVTYHVVVGAMVVDRDTRTAAEALARDIPGAKVGYRVHRRGPLKFGYWTGELKTVAMPKSPEDWAALAKAKPCGCHCMAAVQS